LKSRIAFVLVVLKAQRMSSVSSMVVPEKLSESRRAALLNLLADETPAIYHTVRDKILSYGPQAAGWLRPHALSSDAVLRRRAQEIVMHFDRQAADNRFLAFCLKHGEEFDPEQAAWLLAQTQYPDINIEAYAALLDNYAGELRGRLDVTADARQTLAVINKYLFQELGFSGDDQNYYDPQNSYLNRVIDQRKGNPINLCLLYILLARRLQLPVAGIGLPGHFLCRYQSSASELYIDAFHGGKVLSKADCVQYLIRGKHGLGEDYLTPVNSRRMLLRICGNLHQIYLRLELTEETTRVQRYLVALAR
jgi:regulator of sirC expression with transglutaminase-like and TPR domain